jgi:hypothetical protein
VLELERDLLLWGGGGIPEKEVSAKDERAGGARARGVGAAARRRRSATTIAGPSVPPTRTHQVGVRPILRLARLRAAPDEHLAEPALAELAVDKVLGRAADLDLLVGLVVRGTRAG